MKSEINALIKFTNQCFTVIALLNLISRKYVSKWEEISKGKLINCTTFNFRFAASFQKFVIIKLDENSTVYSDAFRALV